MIFRDRETVLDKSLHVELDGLVHPLLSLLASCPVAIHPGRSGGYAE